jgi:hypothetical protein
MVYAVTQKNKLVIGTLPIIIAAQHVFGIWSIVKTAMSTGKFSNRFSVGVRTHIGF